jgi:hypothetical protein
MNDVRILGVKMGQMGQHRVLVLAVGQPGRDDFSSQTWIVDALVGTPLDSLIRSLIDLKQEYLICSGPTKES